MDSRLHNMPDVLNISELQAVLRVGKHAAYGLVNTGVIKGIRVGRSIRIPKRAVLNYLGKGEE